MCLASPEYFDNTVQCFSSRFGILNERKTDVALAGIAAAAMRDGTLACGICCIIHDILLSGL